MSEQDVYAPPRSAVRDVSGGSGLMSDRLIAALRKTRPWVLLFAILGFVFSAFMVVAGVPMLLGAGMMTGMEGLEGVEGAGMIGGGMMIGMGVFYILSGVIYFLASLYLLKYAGAIKRAVTSLSTDELETALEKQASFWKLMGILTVIAIIAMIVMMVGGLGSLIMMNGAS